MARTYANACRKPRNERRVSRSARQRRRLDPASGCRGTADAQTVVFDPYGEPSLIGFLDDPHAERASYTGATLGGRYTVGPLLARGGWGSVYEAKQRDLGRRVALKILHADRGFVGEGLTRLAREARSLAALGHPNVAQVSDFHATPGEPPFLVMEYLTGQSLGDLLRKEPLLSPLRVCAIAHQILSALDAAHRAGIVHRDVKPDNVFLVSMGGIDDFVKLLDFGIAKINSDLDEPVTEAGALLGTPAFMAPEQITDSSVDHRADIYAVGATMYYALTAQQPIEAQSITALLYGILHRRPIPVASLDPRIDARLSGIIDRAMHKDPVARFASAAEMRAALAPWVRGTPPPLRTVALPSAIEPVPPTLRSVESSNDDAGARPLASTSHQSVFPHVAVANAAPRACAGQWAPAPSTTRTTVRTNSSTLPFFAVSLSVAVTLLVLALEVTVLYFVTRPSTEHQGTRTDAIAWLKAACHGRR